MSTALFICFFLLCTFLNISATLNSVWGDNANNVVFTLGNNVNKIDRATQLLTTVAGTDQAGYGGDNGPATSAKLNSPAGLWMDPKNNVYIADFENTLIRKVSTSGIISTVAGGGALSQYTSTLASSVDLKQPISVFGDTTGALFITDSGSHVVSKIYMGQITPIAGTFKAGHAGTASAATASDLSSPSGVWVDGTTGVMYIADTGNNCIRAVNLKSGSMNYNSVAINGPVAIFGEKSLKYPITVLYLTSSKDNAVYIFDMISTVWLTLAGGASGGLSAGDGGNGVHAGARTLNNPRGVWKEPLVNKEDEDTAYLYIADKGNGKIRKLTWELKIFDYYGGQAATHSLQPVSLPTVRPSASPAVVQHSSDEGGQSHETHSPVLLIVVITVCILSLLGGILLCVFRFLYDWPMFPWERRADSSPSQPDNQFEFVTYRSLPSGEGTSPI